MNAIMAMLLFVALLALFSGAATAKQVKVCTTITLPEKGKCVTKVIQGYKVRVCG